MIRTIYARDFAGADATWSNVPTTHLITIEIGIGILCTCVPTYRPLLKSLFPHTRSNLGGKISKTDDVSSSSDRRSVGSSGWRRVGRQVVATGKVWGDSVLETGAEDDGYVDHVQLARPTNRAKVEEENYEMR